MNKACMKGILLAGVVLLFEPGNLLAHEMVSADMVSLSPGQVIAVMKSDFLVPNGFGWLPGPMFYLGHKEILGLSPQQIGKIRRIARRIMPATIRQGREIDSLKKKVVRLSDGRLPLKESEIRGILNQIGMKEAKANLEHILAHRACLDLLTPVQRKRLFSILSSHT
ncbi:MAG: hypothetical protein M1509_00805 [Nitrospirae bacterium]|jgi:hypothetical protein|uniref:Uncharacterized protein n=1 Tax=Leptospirillum ferrodiazotrophum TaxID=412449 RepID=C6HVE2_9BACT|nr:MAG: hypothetical protein UBAL3_78920109 [Leptospirillum ferrodiazotrophum]MCL5953034.1 hypothetical protein [Nitrospirota bacterium]